MMRKFYSLILSLLITGSIHAQNADFPQLIWADEFDVAGAPNPENWTYDLGDNGWGNQELQNYTDKSENVKVEGGLLKITAIRKGENSYTSGRIKTQGLQSFTYGRFEIRAKLPAGRGLWPAIWMLGENISTEGWPACGEIDIMEHVGFDPDNVHSATHTPSSYGNTVNKGSLHLPTAETEFHVYTLEWTEAELKFLVDDQHVYTYSPSVKNASTWPYNLPQFMILNVAVGGAWGGQQGIDDSVFPKQMLVDYVRVYGKAQAPKISGPELVKVGETYTYSTDLNESATYEWIFPEGVTILSGQGTNTVSVQWGESAGEIKVNLQQGEETFEGSLPVKLWKTPSGDMGFNLLEKWIVSPNHESEIQVGGTSEVAELTFEISDPKTIPFVDYLFEDTYLNLEEHTLFDLEMATTSPPKSFRIDLIDIDNNTFNTGDVFKVGNWLADGQFYLYHHDFSFLKAAHPDFDFQRVKGIRFFINYGAFSAPPAGQLKVKSIAFQNNAALQVPAAISKGSATENEGEGAYLNWELPEGDWVKSITVLRSEGGSEIQKEWSLPVGSTTFLDSEVQQDMTYQYQVSLQNQLGSSAGFDLGQVTITQAPVLGFDFSSELVSVFPNPTTDKLTLKGMAGRSISLYNLTGELLEKEKVPNDKSQLDLSSRVSGLYLLKVEGLGTIKVIKK
ncbi:family 16 glycosylhydrolase [Limibacter armeniacum]|uniref:family 16 glycosylhydrolase n=1 Tax=Limibacter armeniacum TaxID=466084 RepID=UPI002FE55794